MDRFRNKQVNESYYIEFDFSSIDAALTLSSAVVTARKVSDGTDVTATLTTAVKQLITSPVVYVWVTGGTDGEDYEITCKATASNGAIYELEGLMLVTDTLPSTSRFRNKQTGESYYIEFDYSTISSGLTIVSAVVAAAKISDGTDVTAALTTVAKQLITSPVVYSWVTGGTDGEDYRITCRATASDGAVYELEGLMLVADIPETADSVGPTAAKTFLEQTLDDLSVFLDVTGGFAKNATYTPAGGASTTIPVIFDDEYSGSSPIGIEIETTGPQALAKTTDVADVAAGDLLVVGGVTYYVINKRLNPPEGGPGTTLLILSTEWHG